MEKYLLQLIINILFYICISNAFCLSLTTAYNNGYIGCSITKIDYPTNQLKKELSSGLPVRIGVTASLMEGKTVIEKKSIIITVIYDLWDELFNMEIISKTDVINSEYKKITLLINDLKKINVKKIKSLAELDINTTYIFEVSVVLNPVKKEKIKQIQKLVAETGITYRSSGSRSNPPLQAVYKDEDGTGNFLSTGPRFKKLFDKLFEQYTNEDKDIGLWKTGGRSLPFKPGGKLGGK